MQSRWLLTIFSIALFTLLRADFLDACNHFNLGTPSAAIGDTRDGGLPNANAGKIFSRSGSRLIQLGLKYMF